MGGWTQMKDEGVGLSVLCPMDLGDGEYFLYLTERRALWRM